MTPPRWLLPGLVGLALVAAQSGPLVAGRAADGEHDALYRELELFEDALSIVRSDYVETLEAKDLIYGALKGMLATLDPYSQFLDPESYTELKVETQGQFGGLGVEITLKDELLTIITPIDDTPAHRAGLRALDRIVKIDGELTRGITLSEAVQKLRGEPNTQVKLTILREGTSELFDVTMTRAIIEIKSIKDARLVEDRIGYIRLTDFREQTTRDLRESIEGLTEQEMEGLILDLRNNPGGLLDEAVSVSELFLDRRQVIVTTKGRLQQQNMKFTSRVEGPARHVPMVVLINEGSASASEIVAGAIQDHHRGVVLGAKSHGKASVQTIFPLKDGSALRLTTSKYFTPSGRSIHGEGIMPDVDVPFEAAPEDKPDQAEEVFGRVEAEGQSTVKAGGGEPGNDPEAPAPEAFRMDSQLTRAVDLLKGIKVYQSRAGAQP